MSHLQRLVPAWRVLIAALLAVVALQALQPRPLPLRADNGPAFSASSVETALPARRMQGVELKVAPVFPPLTHPPEERAVLPVLVRGEVDGLRLAPAREPPPPPSVLEPAAAPRAPPVS